MSTEFQMIQPNLTIDRDMNISFANRVFKALLNISERATYSMNFYVKQPKNQSDKLGFLEY